MPDRSRIPVAPRKFNPYIVNSDNYLQATGPAPPNMPNWQRLGLTQQNADEWHSQRDYWENTLFKKYSNPDRRTKTVNLAVKNFIVSFRELGSRLLNMMVASPNATEQDEVTLNFKRQRSKPTRLHEPIIELCHASLLPIGGGRAKISCRTQHDTKRASLAARADSVLMAFKIGDPTPRHPNDGTTIITRRQAKFDFDFGVESAGKRVHIFICWNDTKRPELQGPWSDMRSIHLF